MSQAVTTPEAPTVFGKVSAPNGDWLAKAAPEAILEPELAIIDTHHHLWDRPGFPYLLPHFRQDIDTGHHVIATVYAECHAMYKASGPVEMRPVGEIQFAAGIAAMSESGLYGSVRVNAGIVGFADLTLGDKVAPVLEAQIAVGGGRFKGVRHSAAWDASPVIGNSRVAGGPGLYGRPAFREGLKRMSAYGLSLDAWAFHPQLSDVVALAKACPEANIILGHMGGPLGYGPYGGKKDEVFAQWKAQMTELARCPNVSVKLGGVMMRLAAYDYKKEPVPPSSEVLAKLWGPYVLTCIELFGADRCVVESNFPVEKMGIGYAALWNTLKRITAGASPTEKRAIFSETAKRVYRLCLD